jgi:hypothetical protein
MMNGSNFPALDEIDDGHDDTPGFMEHSALDGASILARNAARGEFEAAQRALGVAVAALDAAQNSSEHFRSPSRANAALDEAVRRHNDAKARYDRAREALDRAERYAETHAAEERITRLEKMLVECSDDGLRAATAKPLNELGLAIGRGGIEDIPDRVLPSARKAFGQLEEAIATHNRKIDEARDAVHEVRRSLTGSWQDIDVARRLNALQLSRAHVEHVLGESLELSPPEAAALVMRLRGVEPKKPETYVAPQTFRDGRRVPNASHQSYGVRFTGGAR